MKTGIELIAEERQRQIEKEGWTAEHDKQHDDEELVDAAVCYLLQSPDMQINVQTESVIVEAKKAIWPWSIKWWKPSPQNRIKELVKAGALIAAQIDKLTNTQ